MRDIWVCRIILQTGKGAQMSLKDLIDLANIKVDRNKKPLLIFVMAAYVSSIVLPVFIQSLPGILQALPRDNPVVIRLDIDQTVAITRYTTTFYVKPQLVDYKSYLLRYYPVDQDDIRGSGVEQFLTNITRAYSEAYRRELNSFPMFSPGIGDWYLNEFPYDEFYKQIYSITMLYEDYTSESDRLSIIDRKVSLMEVWLLNYHGATADRLREHLAAVRQDSTGD